MSTQAKALRLADELDAVPETGADPDLIQETAAELRRLHAENERLSATVKAREDEILTHSEAFYEATRLLSEEREKNERLLEALKKMRIKYGEYACRVCNQADAAIKAAEGEKT
jgi:lipid A disaccharide synthetase